MTCENANEDSKESFESIFSRYQISLEKSMKGSNFNFDSIQLLQYKYHRINFRHVGHISSPDWLKNKYATKQATINPKNKDDRCFQYAATVALNFDEIKKDPHRVSKV